MNEPQLPLFDWVTTVMSEGYRCMAEFRFDEAEEYFKEVQESDQEDEGEVNKAKMACSLWRRLLVQHRQNSDEFPTEALYKELLDFKFENVPGLHQLKKALLEYITKCFISDHRYYIYEDITVADLLMELREYEKAEQLIIYWYEHHPDDAQIQYSLAQIQWLNKQKGEAKKNYARALLYDPCRVPFHRILYPQLKNLIEDVGAEIAPAYGWVRGVLPMVSVRQKITYCSDAHRWAENCYQLFLRADKALKKNDMDVCVEVRKKIKAEAPKLYNEYFALLSGGNK